MLLLQQPPPELVSHSSLCKSRSEAERQLTAGFRESSTARQTCNKHQAKKAHPSKWLYYRTHTISPRLSLSNPPPFQIPTSLNSDKNQAWPISALAAPPRAAARESTHLNPLTSLEWGHKTPRAHPQAGSACKPSQKSSLPPSRWGWKPWGGPAPSFFPLNLSDTSFFFPEQEELTSSPTANPPQVPRWR